jgi:hypothetical protein
MRVPEAKDPLLKRYWQSMETFKSDFQEIEILSISPLFMRVSKRIQRFCKWLLGTRNSAKFTLVAGEKLRKIVETGRWKCTFPKTQFQQLAKKENFK